MRSVSSVVIFVAIALSCYSTPTSAQSLPQNATGDQNVINPSAEHKAYLAALNTQNPFTVEAFVTRYPQSGEIREILDHLMVSYLKPADEYSGYSSADAKLRELAQRLLELAPDDIRALAVMTALDRERVRLGMPGATNEVCADSQSGLQQLPDWQPSEKIRRVDLKQQGRTMADTFNGAAGLCAFLRQDLPTARSFYKKALLLNPAKPEDLYELARTDLDMKPIDPDGFLYCARVIHLLNPAHKREAKSLAKYCEARYLQFHAAGDGWEQIVKQGAAEKDNARQFRFERRKPEHRPLKE